ncbi:unnamed protein product [marine sediment metagenome]|uniref:Uncharacterized protein n=1 Tax=marine sediment metagenome TaxID=412755 RepID=X1SHU7_9ZZZZ
MTTKSWRMEAKRRWGKKAAWIHGDGQFALLAWCRVLTVTLYTTRTEAEEQKKEIDRTACGGLCTGDHEIIDLSIT